MEKTPKDAIMYKAEVAEADKTAVYRPGLGFAEPPREKVMPRNLFFVGLRGSGKTSLGKAVAEALGMAFADTDEIIQARAGKTIRELVEEGGWQPFRDLESAVLAEVCAGQGQVVATGGGIVERPENRKLLADSGLVFYLMTSIPTLVARLTAVPGAEQRPPLSGLPLEDELRQTFNRREPLYMEIAAYYLQADKSLEELVEAVREKLELL